MKPIVIKLLTSNYNSILYPRLMGPIHKILVESWSGIGNISEWSFLLLLYQNYSCVEMPNIFCLKKKTSLVNLLNNLIIVMCNDYGYKMNVRWSYIVYRHIGAIYYNYNYILFANFKAIKILFNNTFFQKVDIIT